MRARAKAATACLALATLGGVVALTAPGAATGDRCPADRDVLATVSYHGSFYGELHEAVGTYVREHGYRLGPENRERIADASREAIASSTSDEITVDPNLPDTDRVVDLIVTVRATPAGGFEVVGGSFCARVVGGEVP